MIVPSIDVAGGRAIQLRQGREHVLDGGDPLARLEEFSVAGEVAVVDLDAALGSGDNSALIRTMVQRAPCRVGGGIRQVDQALDWLDWGATKVVIGTAASVGFCAQLPRERVIAAVDAMRREVVVEGWRAATGRDALDVIAQLAPHVGGFLLTQVEHEGAMQGFDVALVRDAVAAAGHARVTAAGGITTGAEIAEVDRLGADAQVGMALYSGRLSLGDAFASPLVSSEPLWPTVVCEESGRALGLAWSNLESLSRAIAERRGIYWSRSRRALWMKGETSGNRQDLVRVEADCDRDTLRFVVCQHGSGFCHRGTWSCWGDDFDLPQLERVIAQRVATGEPESGTVRLIRESSLLETKLVEEARELGDAATRRDVIDETSDLLYFALVALARRGGALSDVVEELARRHRRVRRRPMRAKPAGEPEP
jgi:phosphoribosyl-ATP pyrophosphohydrolase